MRVIYSRKTVESICMKERAVLGKVLVRSLYGDIRDNFFILLREGEKLSAGSNRVETL